MYITREVDYALRILRALQGGSIVPVKQLCEAEDVPVPFSYKILKKLSQANMIHIWRGACGGYQLACDLSQVTIYDVLHALGEYEYLNVCLEPGYLCTRHGALVEGKPQPCMLCMELCRIQKILDTEISRHSLKDIFSGSCSCNVTQEETPAQA